MILAFVLVGQFAVVSAIGSLNVALPVIQAEFGASPSDLQWTIVVYQIAYAMTLITGGRLGDMFGRRRIFVVGLCGFIVAAGLCAFAPTISVMIIARFVQGLAGGMSSNSSPDPRRVPCARAGPGGTPVHRRGR